MQNISLMEQLETYCRDVIRNYPENGYDWAFGAVEFARNARLIDVTQYCRLLNEFHGFKKMDPSGGNRMGSSKQ